MRQFLINANDGGQRLDKFVFKTVKSMPSSLLYKSLRLKKIKVNGKRAEGGTILSAGDTVTFYLPDSFFEEGEEKERRKEDLLRVDARLNVLYEDGSVLVVEKPEGMLSHTGDETEAHSEDFSLRSTLLYRIWAYLCRKGEYDPSSENSFAPSLCHRLDRNTGGLVIAAKTAEALREMNRVIREGLLEKHYLCAVHGKMSEPHRLLCAYLGKDARTKTVTVFDNPGKGLREIRTEYRVIRYSSRYDLSLLDVRLHTGRTHQIRAHLAHVGHPLLGEGKYGTNREDRELGYAHQALWAYLIRFPELEGPLAGLSGKTLRSDGEKIRFLTLFGGKSALS